MTTAPLGGLHVNLVIILMSLAFIFAREPVTAHIRAIGI